MVLVLAMTKRAVHVCVWGGGVWVSPEVSDGDKDLLAHGAEERMHRLLFYQHLQ